MSMGDYFHESKSTLKKQSLANAAQILVSRFPEVKWKCKSSVAAL
jgi:hypothetical protein